MTFPLFTSTLMEQEAHQTPTIIAKQWQENKNIFEKLAAHLKNNPPSFAMTIARGSSDNACTFGKYLLETRLGLATASAAPSTLTLYKSHLKLKNALVIAVSQSGKSPDICEMMASAKAENATTVALVNQLDSPLAKIADFVIPLWAGEEKAVAATKSYIASLSALIQLVTYVADDKALLKAAIQLPEYLEKSLQENWAGLITELQTVQDILVLGRGYGFPIAQEAALKFKETLSLHAEAFSTAEVLHGPFGLVKKDFPLLIFTQNDPSLLDILALSEKAKNLGARTLLALSRDHLNHANLHQSASMILPLPASLHPICDPLMAIQAFYPIAAGLAVSRGFNPDAPANLKKVTETR